MLLLIPAFALAQTRVAATIDTIAITIGEDIQYNIEVKVDSTALVIFPQGQTFLPFEIIDTTKVDVQKLADEALWKRSYSLIQFDSGSYYIPRQKVMVNGSPIFYRLSQNRGLFCRGGHAQTAITPNQTHHCD